VWEGQTFVAMEHIRGTNLARWLATPRTELERLSVFVQAGRGLAAAHAAGLVHRDFKPENVLVGDDGRVCVADFGLVGKAAAPTERGATGRASSAAGTPRYMAPEQHRGAAPDARSDQYSFCVALHEALYGFHPLEPAASRKTDVASIPKRVRGAIARGLSQNAEDRFASMEPLLQALAPEPGSRARGVVIAGVALSAVLVVAVVAMKQAKADPCVVPIDSWSGSWDAAARARLQRFFEGAGTPLARRAWDIVEADTNQFTQQWTDQYVQACRDSRVHGRQSDQLLDLRMFCLRKMALSLGSQLEVLATSDAKILTSAPRVTAELPRVADCADVELLRRVQPLPADPGTRARIEEVSRLAATAVASFRAEREGAELLAEKAVSAARELEFLPAKVDALLAYSRVAFWKPDAEAAIREALAGAVESRYDRQAAEAWLQLAISLSWKAHRDEAGAAFELASAAARGLSDPQLSARLELALADAAFAEARYEASLRHCEAAERFARRADFLDLAAVFACAGKALTGQEKHSEALERFTAALHARQERLGDGHPGLAYYRLCVGNALSVLKRFDEAVRELTAARDAYAVTLGSEEALASTEHNLGGAWLRRGDAKKALEHYERALAIRELEKQPLRIAQAQIAIAWTLIHLKRPVEAEKVFNKATAMMDRSPSPGHRSTLERWTAAVDLYDALKRPGQAARARRELARLTAQTN
jgi:eukaryotic-like serine/threonine-protein kinase